METKTEVVEEIVVEETLSDKIANFLSEHPFIGLTLFGVGCIGVVLPGLALYGTVVGRIAGKQAAKFLVEAGVKLA